MGAGPAVDHQLPDDGVADRRAPGRKPDEAFFVVCDRTTMTQDDIDNGRLICVIGIAPVKPAEFVIFRIQQKTQHSSCPHSGA